MRSYAAYRRWRGMGGQAETMILSDGFSWGAALFGPAWALFYGRWRTAAVLALGWAVAGVLAAAAGPAGGGAILLLAAIWSGAVARGLSEFWAGDQDWRLQDVVIAADFDAAEAALIRADAARADDAERRW